MRESANSVLPPRFRSEGGILTARRQENEARRGLKEESTWKRAVPLKPRMCILCETRSATCLPELSARGVGIKHIAHAVNVAGVEEFVEMISRFPAGDHVSSDVVELAQSAGKVNVRRVVEACVAKDADTVLSIISSSLAVALAEV